MGSLDRVDADLHARLARKEKIMGFGHRPYTPEDPRATHLRAMSEEVARASHDTSLYDMSRRIENIIKDEKKLNANVDFYSASVFAMLGIPADLSPRFSPSRESPAGRRTF